MAARTTSSSFERLATGRMSFDSLRSMYQVVRRPPQPAPVPARARRESLAAGVPYSSCHQDTWVTPLYVNPAPPGGGVAVGVGLDGLPPPPPQPESSAISAKATRTESGRGRRAVTGPPCG